MSKSAPTGRISPLRGALSGLNPLREEITFSLSLSNRVLVFALISTLIGAFGAMGAYIGSFFGQEYPLVGLLLGSVLGLFLAIHDATLYGCLIGMVVGLIVGVFTYYLINFETAYMVVFLFSLFGAFLGEPFAYFWREADEPFSDSDDPDSGEGEKGP